MTSVIHGAQVAIEIRRLGPEDAPILERIAADVFDEPVRPDRLAAYLAEPGHHLWATTWPSSIAIPTSRQSSTSTRWG